MVLELVLQIIEVVKLVSLRRTYELMASHILNLPQIIFSKPVCDYAAADLFCVDHFGIELF